MVNIESRVTDDKIIVRLSGRIGGESSIEMYRELKNIINDNNNKSLILDFGKLDFIDSSGLGSLVAINSTLLKQGLTLTLASIPDNLMDLLRVTNLDRVLNIVMKVEDED